MESPIPPSSISSPEKTPEELKQLFRGLWRAPDSTPGLIVRQLDSIQIRAVTWLWEGWIPLGYTTIWAGETGAGKSTVLADVAARVTTGAPWPGQTTPRVPARVLWLGSEDGIEEMTAPRLLACGANLKHVVEIQGTGSSKGKKAFSMQDDISAVIDHVTHNNVQRTDLPPFRLLVIDPITSYLSGTQLRKVDLNDAGQLRTILEPWFKVANALGIAIVFVTHLNKDTSRSMIHRILGSSAFVQTCRSLCAVIARPEDGMYSKALMQVKTNLPEHPGGSWKFTTEKFQVGTDPTNGMPIVATRPIWEELSTELTPDSVIGKERGPVSKYQVSFGIWLQAYFLTTPPNQYQPVSEVKQAAITDRAASARWWDEHSGEYLEKINSNGTWMCRRKDANKTK